MSILPVEEREEGLELHPFAAAATATSERPNDVNGHRGTGISSHAAEAYAASSPGEDDDADPSGKLFHKTVSTPSLALPTGHPVEWEWDAILRRQAHLPPTSGTSLVPNANGDDDDDDDHGESGDEADSSPVLWGTTPLPRGLLATPLATLPFRSLFPRVLRLLVTVNTTAVVLALMLMPVLYLRWAVNAYTGLRRPDAEYLDYEYVLDLRGTMFWLFAGVMTAGVLTFPVVVWTAMHGWRKYGDIVARWVPSIVVGSMAYWVFYFVLMVRIGREKGVVLAGQESFAPFFVFNLTTYLMSRRAGLIAKLPTVPRRVTVAYLGLVVATFIYFYVCPRLWFAPWMTDLGRILIRLVLHPILFELANFMVRMLVRSTNLRVSPRRLFFMLVPGIMMNSLYGRFLVSASSSTTVTVILAVLLAAQEIILRVSVGARDRFLYRLFHSAEKTRTRFSSTQSVRLRADIVAFEQIVENSSIVVCSAMTYLFDLSVDGSAVTLDRVVLDCSLQLIIELVTDFIVTVAEIRWGRIPILEAWDTRYDKGEWLRHHAYMVILALASMNYFVTTFVSNSQGWISFRPD